MPHITASPQLCELRPKTGGGSPTACLASSTSRQVPDCTNYDPGWAVVVPPPVSHPPRHGKPPIVRITTRLASSTSQQAPDCYKLRPILHPPHHGEPPILRITTHLAPSTLARAVDQPPPVLLPPPTSLPPVDYIVEIYVLFSVKKSQKKAV